MGDSEMKFRGTLSYLEASENTVELENGLNVKISRINDDVARVYFVKADTSEEQSVPPGYVFRNLTTGTIVGSYCDAWLISWTSNYEMSYYGGVVLNIDQQREQVILEGTIVSAGDY